MGLDPWPGALHPTHSCLENVWLSPHASLDLPTYTQPFLFEVIVFLTKYLVKNPIFFRNAERNRAHRLWSPLFLKAWLQRP